MQVTEPVVEVAAIASGVVCTLQTHEGAFGKATANVTVQAVANAPAVKVPDWLLLFGPRIPVPAVQAIDGIGVDEDTIP